MKNTEHIASYLRDTPLGRERHSPAGRWDSGAGVVVTPAGDQGQWTADGETRTGIHMMYDCGRAMNEIAKTLSRDYHLANDGSA